MMPAPPRLMDFTVSLLGVSAIEGAALTLAGLLHPSHIQLLLLTRCLQGGFLLWMLKRQAAPGLKPGAPLLKSLLPSLILCLLMLAAALLQVRWNLPSLPAPFGARSAPAENGPLFFLVACVVAPFAEELFFRGTVFRYFRRFGFLPALVISSLLFSTFHSTDCSFPLLPLAGGILAAAVYEQGRTLAAPLLLPGWGNFLLFFVIGATPGW